MSKDTIGFIGSGNMGEAIIRGLLTGGLYKPQDIYAGDVRSDRLDYLKEKFKIHTSTSNEKVINSSSIIFLSVKPQKLKDVLVEISDYLTEDKVIISIIAGATLSSIEALVKKDLRLIRSMPNTPALIGAAATAISAGRHAKSEDIETAHKIFNSIGKTVDIEEELLDAVTGMSGCGPAYTFLIIDALADAGVKVGLPRDVSQFLAAQTIFGAAKMLLETKEHPGKLKDMVTSPGGCAIAGLHVLESGGLRATLINAVEKATERSKYFTELM